MTQSPLQPVHVFPYCHKVSGGHNNAIRAMVLAEISQGLEVLTFCAFCDDPQLKKLRSGILVARRHGPAGDPSNEQVIEVPLEAPGRIFHLHGVNRVIMHAARCLRRKGVPYVMTSHGALNYRNPLHYLEKFIFLNFFTGLARKSRGFHLLNEICRRRLHRLMPTWSGATLVQWHPVDLPDFSQFPKGARANFGVPADGFLFLYLGRLDVYTKGLDILIQAFSQVADLPARLALVGPDWQGGRAQLEALARELGCADYVHFLGPRYGAEKWAALRLADAFVAPSRWDAGPVALMEALGVGLPVITSTAINPAELLSKNHLAYLCPLMASEVARGMNIVMGDAALRHELGARGQAWVKKECSPAVVGQALARFYDQALAGDT